MLREQSSIFNMSRKVGSLGGVVLTTGLPETGLGLLDAHLHLGERFCSWRLGD